MRAFIDGQDWLTVLQLPAYAPKLNPVEVWSPAATRLHRQRRLHNPDHLIRTVREGLRKLQYRPALLDGCLAETGLALRPR
ncbi:hypothetical protein ABZ078_24275 [Streptomyces sp. NPDC006385]|uniref:hypothetical protein n=1 Tax=Streptomyces sp. NPDC006385 TaxID=3156761 RepID=UPI0033A01121